MFVNVHGLYGCVKCVYICKCQARVLYQSMLGVCVCERVKHMCYKREKRVHVCVYERDKRVCIWARPACVRV